MRVLNPLPNRAIEIGAFHTFRRLPHIRNVWKVHTDRVSRYNR